MVHQYPSGPSGHGVVVGGQVLEVSGSHVVEVVVVEVVVVVHSGSVSQSSPSLKQAVNEYSPSTSPHLGGKGQQHGTCVVVVDVVVEVVVVKSFLPPPSGGQIGSAVVEVVVLVVAPGVVVNGSTVVVVVGS